MSTGAVRFGPFRLDPINRRLCRDGKQIDLNSRYMDALILLVDARGTLVSKDAFMERVWQGVPVTDEALTQAVRTLRKALGDSAVSPSFIETVPKHGYRFVAPVEEAGDLEDRPFEDAPRSSFRRRTIAGTCGAMAAGALVGLLYGFADAGGDGAGAVSSLLVFVLVATLCSGIGGAAIAAGFSAAVEVRPPRWYWRVAGASLSGLVVGAAANLIGRDAFRLLFGRSIADFAGALEGLIMGTVIGLGAHWASEQPRLAIGTSAVLGLAGGAAVALLDGRMMAGSLSELVRAFPSSQLRLDGLARTLGERAFGEVSRVATSALEGALFAAGVVWGIGGSGLYPQTPPRRRV